MTRGGARVACVAALGVAVAAAGAPARADEKGVCAEKYQSAQRERAAGKLTDARADLLRCAEQSCPAFVSNDCKTWLAQVEAELPTLVFAVLGAGGADVADAALRVDGVLVANATDGLGHAVDPGAHELEVVAGGETIRQHLVVRVGEKSRRVEVRLAPPASEGAPVPVAGLVLGGVAIGAIGAGTVLWVSGSGAAHTYNDLCAQGACTAAQHDDALRQLVAGDVAWGVGIAAAVAAGIVLLTKHDGAKAAVAVGPGGVAVVGTF